MATLRAILTLALLAPSCAPSNAAPTDPSHAAPSSAIEWRTWSAAAFERAKRDDRIILINIVAKWCHWCHEMERRTYADPEVAALLRDRFVTIRVDSDAHPDVAERYRAWGWPATAVLSPRAEPIVELRGFQPPGAFATLLRDLVTEQDAGELARRSPPTAEPRPTDADIEQIRARVVAQLDGYYDPERGGWGRRQKYPFPELVEHALLRARVHDAPIWSDRATQTLAGETKLVDPVWGGMYQYSVRGDWNHPHYEKITAIQAGAIVDFAQAYRATRRTRWLDEARSIAGYMTSMMQDDRGGFFTSQDADLRRADKPTIVGAEYYRRDDAGRRALGQPRIDRNVYADLNGAMILALAELYAATGDPEILDTARRTADRLLTTHATEDGGFTHGPRPDPRGLAYLRDQAAMGRALLALYRVTGEIEWLDAAQRVGAFMQRALEDPKHGGFFAHTENADAVGVFARRRKPIEENGLAARFLIALHRHLDDGETPYLESARAALRAVGDPKALHQRGRIIGTYALALEELSMPTVDATITGDPDDHRTRSLLLAALRWYEPRAIIDHDPNNDRYPDIGRPAAYLCTATACSSPVTDPAEFARKATAFTASLR